MDKIILVILLDLLEHQYQDVLRWNQRETCRWQWDCSWGFSWAVFNGRGHRGNVAHLHRNIWLYEDYYVARLHYCMLTSFFIIIGWARRTQRKGSSKSLHPSNNECQTPREKSDIEGQIPRPTWHVSNYSSCNILRIWYNITREIYEWNVSPIYYIL